MRRSHVIAMLCGLLSTACSDEVARVRSLDGRIDAVLLETNGGATTDFGYDVYLAAVDQRLTPRKLVAMLYGASRNKQAYGVNLVWQDAQHLTIEYLEARQDTLLRDSIRLAGRNLFVRLRPGVLDSTAPPGGMLYNLERTRRQRR
jgi:hypothetical protein